MVRVFWLRWLRRIERFLAEWLRRLRREIGGEVRLQVQFAKLGGE